MTQPSRTERAGCKETLAAFVAMTFLFSYMRRPSFMAVVYPAGLTVPASELGRFTEPTMPLAALILAAILLALWGRGGGRRIFEALPIVAGPLGSLGVALAFLVQVGFFGASWMGVSGVLCGLGFVGAVLLAGTGLGRRGLLWSTGVIAVAYAANFALFIALRQTGLVRSVVLVTPLMATLPWFLVRDAGAERPSDGRWLTSVVREPLLGVLFMLVMTGGAIRGIVGEGDSPNAVRTWISATLVALAVLTWLGGVLAARTTRASDRSIARGTLGASVVWWLLLTVVFLAGVFAYVAGDGATGIYVVASVRAVFDALWWVALCVVVRQGQTSAPSVPLFLFWGVGAWAVLWLGGYWVVPGLLGLGADGPTVVAPQTVALIAVFALACILVVTCLVLVLQRSGTARESEPAEAPAAPDTADERRRLMGAYGLTDREAEVALLFAQGFSIGSVAQQLGIERSTAQSHSKAIYRKMDIHTKDDLIARVREAAA